MSAASTLSTITGVGTVYPVPSVISSTDCIKISSMNGTLTSPFGRGAEIEQRWRECLDRIEIKDSEALSQLYDETVRLLNGLAMRILNDSADAEEVVLDVYQHVWNSAHSFDETRGTVWSWLVVLTRSRAIDRLRRAGARRVREIPVEHSPDRSSNCPGPETESIYGEERRIVRRALEQLSEGEREAIELAFFRGLTHVEVADALGQPLGTIKTRIRMGMRRLREALAPLASS